MRRRSGTASARPLKLGPVLDFMRLLWSLNHELEALSKNMDATFGVTGPQRLVLRIVGRMPGISAGQLATVLHVHPSTLTGILRRLVDRELLERQHDPSDGRRALLALTPRGRAIDALRAGTVEAAIERALRRVPADGLSAVTGVLEVMASTLRAEATRSRTR